jgi:erythromycin esterase-like protein
MKAETQSPKRFASPSPKLSPRRRHRRALLAGAALALLGARTLVFSVGRWPLATAHAIACVFLVAACKTYESETAVIAPQALYFPTPRSSAEIPPELVDALGEADILLLGESHYVTEHHQFLALLLPRLHERGFRLFLTEWNHSHGWVFDEYVTGRRESLTPEQSSLDGVWLEAVRALNAELRASGRARDQMRVRAIDVNHWRAIYRAGALELVTRSGNEGLIKRIQALPPTDTSGYLESIEALEADIGRAKDRMGLSEPDLAALREMTTVEIASTRYRANRSMEDRESAMYDAIVAAMGSLFQGERVVIHCGRMHAQLSQEWRVEPFQGWHHFGVRLAEDCRESSKRIFSLACFGARGEQKHSFKDPARHSFDIMDHSTADSLSRAIDAAADGRIAYVDLRNTGVIGRARIDFDCGRSSTARPGAQFSGILLYPQASVLPSSAWFETNFRD